MHSFNYSDRTKWLVRDANFKRSDRYTRNKMKRWRLLTPITSYLNISQSSESIVTIFTPEGGRYIWHFNVYIRLKTQCRRTSAFHRFRRNWAHNLFYTSILIGHGIPIKESHGNITRFLPKSITEKIYVLI